MSAERIDFAAEGLLDGLEGKEREERLSLLERFSADGVPLEELRRATANGTLMFVPADRVIAGEERYTLAQIAELSGVELDFLVAVRRAMGLPIADKEEPVYSDIELQAAGLIQVGREAGVSDEETLELVRVLGRALSQVAESLRQFPLKRALEPGISEYDLALRYAQSVAQLHPLVAPLLANSLTLHLRHAAQSEVISAMERSGGRLPGSREVAVCFADLVGFTRLGEEVPPEELGQLAVRLEALATEVARPPVRLVKTIGDAAMLAASEAAPLLDAALELIDGADSEGEHFPQLRAGAALGRAVPRAGDWFGRPVNLASRVTAVARPGSLLAERELHEAAREDYRWSYAGERRLRGIRGSVPLFRARRLSAPPQ
ncbi:MAG: adenylate/guanylate cyclase domain-containing protein [Actinobacteria bacterium]|nr:MAG: adenylate/guanylate cyclase domain-containing protein [Actinomycetota bacterium]